MTSTTTQPRAHVLAGRPRVLLNSLAGLGALFVVFQMWGYVAWLLSDGFAEASPADLARNGQTSKVWFGYVLMWTVAALWTRFLVKESRRLRSLSWPAVVTAAWTLTLWQESLANVTGPRYAWNAAFFDRGDWTPYLPFVTNEGPGLPMPMLMEPFVFFGFLPAAGFAVAAFMRWLTRRFGITNGWALAGIAYVVVLVLEFSFEMASIAQYNHSYPVAYGPLTVFDGTRFQFPLYENWLLGLMWLLPGLAVYFLRDLRGGRDALPVRWLPGRAGAVVTCLAATGALNVAFLLYNLIAFVWLPGNVTAPMPPALTP